MVIGNPFHEELLVFGKVQFAPLLGHVFAMYGFLWIGVFIASWWGLDLRWETKTLRYEASLFRGLQNQR